MNARSAAWLAGLALAFVAAGLARAQSLPPELAALDPPLRESGAGPFRYFGFHVYDARLWVAGERFDPRARFVLGLRYSREIAGEDIARSSADEIRRLAGASAPDLERWAERMRRLFPSVKPGDEIVGVHQPERGARFFHNGRLLGEIAEPAFARAFFAIWLDPRTRGTALRRALLGEPAEAG